MDTVERNERERERIEKRRQMEVKRELAEGGDVKAIGEMFGVDYPKIVRDKNLFTEAIDRVDGKLKEGHKNDYYLYKSVADELMDEVENKPALLDTQEEHSRVIREMGNQRHKIQHADYDIY